MRRLFALDPATALKLRDYQRDESKGERDDQFRTALGGYVRSQRPSTSALAGLGALGGSAPGGPRSLAMTPPTGDPGITATLRPSGARPNGTWRSAGRLHSYAFS